MQAGKQGLEGAAAGTASLLSSLRSRERGGKEHPAGESFMLR